MAERRGPNVYSIAAHRGFADALVAGLLPRYREAEVGLARLTLLLPSQRAARTVSEAFIRLAGNEGSAGLLMPRMVVVGDLDLDEALGVLLDPIGVGADIPPAADPTRRWLRVAQLIAEEGGDSAPKGAALLRQAEQLCRTMDRLLVEDVGPEQLLQEPVIGIVGDQAAHWAESTRLFLKVQHRWLTELEERQELDAAARRNRLFDHAAHRWKANPPATPIVAAGVTSAAPALARLLRVVSELPSGSVILPDLDLAMDSMVWEELGCAGAPQKPGGPPFAREDAVTHPQYHLKLLLNRMGVSRAEVRPWHRAGMTAAPPDRSYAISNLFLPPQASAEWAGLPAEKRRLSRVRLMETANPEEEAQAIALLMREALEEPERRVALVTPDRGLAGRVAAHLRRWNIEADDTAGRALSQTATGRLLLLLAEVAADHAAPVPLCALLQHPLAGGGEGRAQWLEWARALELRLRGPRPAPGLAPLRAEMAILAREDAGAGNWWASVEEILSPLMPDDVREPAQLSTQIDRLAEAGEALCGMALWSREDGRALAVLVEDVRARAEEVGTMLEPVALPSVLRDLMDQISVRPPYGGHPRVAIYGLLESRMSRADLVICGGLNEGTWPQPPGPDPLLPPAVLRALGVPGADFRIGLAAHDLAGALGAPEVVLSRAQRDIQGPAIPSRFLLRVRALLGEDLLKSHSEIRTVEIARTLDGTEPSAPYERPEPRPSPEQRDVDLAVTALDRLRGDPYQFYASAILRLRSLDPLDAAPSPAWQGTVAHRILETWHNEGGALRPIAERVLDEENAHPLMRGLWQPRLLAALDWIAAEIARLPERRVIAVEERGEMTVDGVRIHGRADRIDRFENGDLAIVDYKTGGPPSGTMVENGFALQLGVIGLMARANGIPGVAGEPTHFEYWSLGKDRKSETGFGYRFEPVKEGRKRTGFVRREFLERTDGYLRDAIARWINGDEPFTARLNPDYPGYADYDQLMRLDEWLARAEDGDSPA
ncbi:double-strand break repair protein AddB [Croceicoccus estronivorus]|uniref:double-strand break repair protein AddB n=1 Tax=Croceicoccus estronivorus TaxID=1172626 RepID=UPI000833367E|nr:double-strand break repair protein AddB [Croceicoccus estronivorus]OCC24808.1 double-strand break repair protein AddB [Croceicoccus estronivorus]